MSKKSHNNYGKIKVRTNDTSVSFQIDFNADLTVGSLEFFKEQVKFPILAEDIEKHCQKETPTTQKDERKLKIKSHFI